MSNVTIGGLVSGIQWQDLIDELMRLERRPVERLESQVESLQARSSAWGLLRGRIEQLQNAAQALADGEAFERYTVSLRGVPAGQSAPFSATATGEVVEGSYQVTVHQLASAEKLGGSLFESRTAALGIEGEFRVNDQTIQVESTDSLEDIIEAINTANRGRDRTGVGATTIRVDDGAYRLILTSEELGAEGIDLRDGPGQVLRQLGLLGAETEVRHPYPGSGAEGALTDLVSDPTAPLAPEVGFTYPPPTGNLTLGPPGYSFAVAIDLETDSLETIAQKINEAAAAEDSDISAEIVTDGAGDSTGHRLQIRGTTSFEDDGGLLEALGILRSSKARVITPGADAIVEIDGETIVRASNTIDDAVPGLVLNLMSAEPGLAIDANVRRNDGPAADQIKSLVKSYNDIVDFIESQSKGSSISGSGIGRDFLVQSMRAQLRDALQAQLPDDGEGGLRRLGEIGVEIGRDGRFTIDSARLEGALAEEPDGVRRLFGLQEELEGGGEVRGVAVALQDIARSLLGTEPGSITSITDRIGEQIGGVGRRIEQMEARLEQKHAQLVRQYAALEQILSHSQSQLDWLSLQIGALGGMG